MECLWEQVYQGEGHGSIPGWLQRMQVAGKGGGVAGDVDYLLRLDVSDALADFCTETGTWRVQHDEIWSCGWRRLKEAERVLHDSFVSGAVEIVGEIGGGGG